jgi:hypothetical protein
LAGIACLLLNACATSYAALHKATVLKPGAFEFGADVTGTLPVSLLAYEAAGTATVKSDLQASQKGQPINIQANSALKDALAVGALLADPPRPVSEFTVRYGLPFAADVGIRGNPEQVRLDFFVQLLTGEWHGVAGVGYMHKWYIDGPVGLASLTPAGYLQRDDGDVTVLVGRDWALASVYFGAKAMYSNFDGAGLAQLVSPSFSTLRLDDHLQQGHATSWIPGLLAGLRAGPPLIQFELEVDIMRTVYSTTVLGINCNFGVFMVVPTAGVVLHLN